MNRLYRFLSFVLTSVSGLALVVVDFPGIIVDLPSQISRGGFFFKAIQFLLRGFHWVGFITGILFLLVIIMNFASF